MVSVKGNVVLDLVSAYRFHNIFKTGVGSIKVYHQRENLEMLTLEEAEDRNLFPSVNPSLIYGEFNFVKSEGYAIILKVPLKSIAYVLGDYQFGVREEILGENIIRENIIHIIEIPIQFYKKRD